MPETQDIIDNIADTIEEEFSGLYCNCKHLLSLHSAGKCRFLGYNSGMYYSCDCTKKVQLEFKIKIYVEEEISDDRTNNSNKKAA